MSGIPLAEAFVRIRADDTTFRTDVEKAVSGTNLAGHGQKAGQQYSAGMSKGAKPLDSGKVTPDADKVAEAGKKSGSRFSSGFGSMVSGFVGGMAASMLLPAITGVFGGMFDEARESQKVGALTAQVIKTTGGAAKITAEQVGDLAGAISAKTGIDDEAIQSGANLLLTFTNLRNEAGAGNDIFNQATQAITDMGAAMGKEPKAAAIQLGKALNDPIKGITALSKVGVSFTEEQKKQIAVMVKAGDVAGAQKVILAELGREFGGAAEAQATAGDKASTAYANMSEALGTALLPLLDGLANVFTEYIAPAMTDAIDVGKDFIGWVQENSDTVKILVGILGGLALAYELTTAAMAIQAAGGFLAWIGKITGATKLWTAAQWLFNTALVDNPIGITITVIAALAAAIYIAYQKSETFRNVVQTGFRAIKVAADFLWNNGIKPMVTFILRGFSMLTDGVATFLDGLSHIPGFGWASDAARAMHNAADEAYRIAAGLNAIPRNVYSTVTVNQIYNKIDRQTGGRAFGAASGGELPGRRISLVGERGPELVIPSSDITVVPAPQTASFLRLMASLGSAPRGVPRISAPPEKRPTETPPAGPTTLYYTVNNPVAEPSSVSLARGVTELSQLGAF